MIAWLRQRKRWNDAANWYARMAEPQSPQEVAAFESWLARDPANAQAYAEMDAIAGAAAARGRNGARGAVRQATKQPLRLARPAYAFALVAAVVAAGAVLVQGPPTPAFAAVVNEGVAVRGVRLADGTSVWLDVGARIGVRLGSKRREIDVREGRVRIVPAAGTRPLSVTARGTEISAPGGRFDVALLPDGVLVSAVEGAVTVAPAPGNQGESAMQLPSGRAVVMDRAGVRSASVDRTWPAGRLRFESASLGRIVALANRRGDPDLLIDEKDISELRVSGVFDLRDTRRLARKLAATLDLEVQQTARGLLLRR
jgi:transmembrane sensor